MMTTATTTMAINNGKNFKMFNGACDVFNFVNKLERKLTFVNVTIDGLVLSIDAESKRGKENIKIEFKDNYELTMFRRFFE